MPIAVLRRASLAGSRLVMAAGLLFSPGFLAASLEALSEEEMSGVSGRDGLAITLQSDGLAADSIEWRVDSGTARQASQFLGTPGDPNSGFLLTGVDPDGANPGSVYTWQAELDMGGDGAGNAAMALQTQWDRTRLRIDDIRHSGDMTSSLGTVVLDAAGSFNLSNIGGPFNMGSNQASLNLTLEDTDLFYRQQPGGDEALFQDLTFNFAFNDGTVGLDGANGLYIGADQVDFDLDFFLNYRENPVTEFITSADVEPMLFYGWRGGFEDFNLHINSGGLDFGSGRTEGLNISLETNFAEGFTWVAGEAAGTLIHFRDYINVNDDVEYAFRLPDITLDTVDAGDGVEGVCFGRAGAPLGDCNILGGEVVELEATGPAFALSLRDAGLHAYPTSVLLEYEGCDPAVQGDCDAFDWGLITTFGDVSHDAYLYPGTEGSDTGVTADLFWSSQSGGGEDWATNTHLMIADTGENVGIGFVNSNLLLTAEQLEFTVGNPLTDQLAGEPRSGLRFASDNLRFVLDAMVGGGDMADLGPQELVRIADWTFDLRGGLDFAIFPAPEPGETYLGYAADMDIRSPAGNSSFLSLAEPSRPNVEFRLTEIDGLLHFGNGRIEVQTPNQTDDGIPRLTFAHDILVPETDLDNNPNYLNVGAVEFAGDRLGSIAVPGGSEWHASFTLKPQELP